MKKLFILAAAAAVAMTSCTQEGNNEKVSGKAITMRGTIEKTDVSRASAMTTERFSSFHVIAFHDEAADPNTPYINTAVWNDPDEGWKYAPKAYYPTSGKLDFYAYSPIGDRNMTDLTLDYGNSGISFDYTVPLDQNVRGGVAEDLLISSRSGLNSGEVEFNFTHALSAASFSAGNRNYDNQELVYVITGIEIENLDTKGTFTFETLNWNVEDDNQKYVAPLPASGVAVEPDADQASQIFKPLLTENDFMIVMPQTTSPSCNVIITYDLRDGSGNMIAQGAKNTFPLNVFNFDMGKHYDFRFEFKGLKAITMSAEVTAWGDPVTTVLVP